MLAAWTSPVSFLAVVFAGLIGGLLLGTAIEQHTLRVLDGRAWLTARHSTDAVFSRLLPWVWNTTLLLLLFAGYLNRGEARWLFLAAAVLLLAGIVVTLAIEVPMNKLIAVWDAEAVPAQWASVRDRWLKFHNVRTGGGGGSVRVRCVGEFSALAMGRVPFPRRTHISEARYGAPVCTDVRCGPPAAPGLCAGKVGRPRGVR